jgi:D-3-phosphoglycerate dehydrogenase
MPYKVVMPEDIAESGKNFLMEKGYEVLVGSGRTDVEYMKEILAEADAILFRTALYNKEVIDAAPKLKVMSRMGVGFDNVDIDYCTQKGIWVTIAPEANSNAVAEHTIGLIIAAAHQIVYMDKQVRAGNWTIRNSKKGRDIAGKTLGIVGFGRTGTLVAKKAALGLDMKVVAYSRSLKEKGYPDYVTPLNSMEEVFEKSDFLSLHMPSTPETKNMVDKVLLSKMKSTAVLINTARGDVLCEEDLYEALKNGTIAYAAVDVMREEPAKRDNRLFELDNFIVTPHNATLTYETMDSMALDAAMGIDDVLNGRIPRWPVNKIER